VTRDELVKAVAGRMQGSFTNLPCPDKMGLPNKNRTLDGMCTARVCFSACRLCWAAAIVDLVKGCKEADTP
jgi:hypothetical protein